MKSLFIIAALMLAGCASTGWSDKKATGSDRVHGVPAPYWADVCLERDDPDACAREYGRAHP